MKDILKTYKSFSKTEYKIDKFKMKRITLNAFDNFKPTIVDSRDNTLQHKYLKDSINTFVEMLKAQYKCIGKSKSEMFFSGRVDDAEKYLDKFIELPFKVRIQVAKQVFKQNDSISIPCLVLGSYKDKCIPITSVIKAGQFFNAKTIIYNDMCHDMMLDCEWREIAKEILLFMNNLLGKE